MNLQFPSYYPVACHTDHIGAGSTYVAIKGDNVDGALYITLAIEKGATRIVVASDAQVSPEDCALMQERNIMFDRVDNPRKALAELSAAALGYPARKLTLLAITGTKGKTTTSWMAYHILRYAGKKVALVSTVANKIGDQTFPASLTTPHPDYMHLFFSLCVDAGIEYVVMETAAQAHSLYRTHNLDFDAVVFTNFSQEHGEFYPTQEEYFTAKKMLCNQVKDTGLLLLNADDERVHALANYQTKTFGFDQTSQYRITAITNRHELAFSFTNSDTNYNVSCPAMAGDFNASNCVAALALCHRAGVSLELGCQALEIFAGVPGRLEKYILSNGALGIVDYAHNPSSYQAVLPMLRTLTDHLIVIFGCGGKRDSSKRPIMGEIAARYADYIILTSDNPRTEDPAVICSDIKAGIPESALKHVACELDRQKAIACAYALSKKGSIIAVFGKGPDEYQIIGTTKHFFSDSGILKSL